MYYTFHHSCDQETVAAPTVAACSIVSLVLYIYIYIERERETYICTHTHVIMLHCLIRFSRFESCGRSCSGDSRPVTRIVVLPRLPPSGWNKKTKCK